MNVWLWAAFVITGAVIVALFLLWFVAGWMKLIDAVVKRTK